MAADVQLMRRSWSAGASRVVWAPDVSFGVQAYGPGVEEMVERDPRGPRNFVRGQRFRSMPA